MISVPTDKRINIGLTKDERKLADEVKKKTGRTFARLFMEYIHKLASEA